MSTRLIIDGNAVYEIDEACQECLRKKAKEDGKKQRKEAPGKKYSSGLKGS